MKNIEIQVYEKYSTIALNSWADVLQENKQDLIHKDRIFLLELCSQIMAYDAGILMQAWKDYPSKNLQAKSIIDHVTNNIKYFGKVSVKEARNRTDNQFRSSFDNIYSEKIKDLNLTAKLMHIIPTDKGVREEARTLNEDFYKEWVPKFHSKIRVDSAKSLKVRFNLSDMIIYNLQLLAFDEIESLVNGKNQVNKNLIQRLERSIERYFPMFLKDLGISNKTNLRLLRKDSKHQFNTACHRCGLRLLKKDNKHYCNQKENRSCYNAKFKEDRDSGFPEAILETKNKCAYCKRPSSLSFIHTHRKLEMQFCSNRCWETYRKRDFRNTKVKISLD